VAGKAGKETKRVLPTEYAKGNINIFFKLESFLVLDSTLVSAEAKDISKQ